MSESEDPSPTLASLRARRGKARSSPSALSRPISPPPLDQGSLLFVQSEDATSTSPELEVYARPGTRLGAAPPKLPPSTPSRHTTASVVSSSVVSSSVVSTSKDRRIWSVGALVTNIRQQVETTYTDLWVEGEISNCRPAPSGHIYFTLKDGEAQLPVVLFRRQAILLRFRPADGLAVLVRGRISIYESRGQLQLIAETMEPRGAGALQLAFEQLKARLLAEGLFDADRKRPLPAFPKCIGIITSPTGAVIRDIVTVTRRRHARLNLLVYPATMQGSTCCTTVAAGIRWFNAHPELVDVILLARGGGSMEDLAGFNDESLARTIAGSHLPIVSAIGHETDFTIADFVADLRAPTPSAAAELITAAQHRIEERVDSLAARVHRAGRFHLLHARQRYACLSSESVLTRLRDSIDRRDQRIDELRLRLESATERRMGTQAHRLAVLMERLRRQNVSLRVSSAHRRLQTANDRLHRTAAGVILNRRARLNQAAARLEALSPLAVLNRGYALIYIQTTPGYIQNTPASMQNAQGPTLDRLTDGTLLRSAADISPGQTIRARLARGTLEATVTAATVTETSNS